MDLQAILTRLDRVLVVLTLVVAGTALAFMAVLSTVNVLLMRKALNDPIQGAEDLMVLALVVVVAVALPFGARTGAHIEIELLEDVLPPRFGRVSYAVMKALGLFLVAFLAWHLWLAGGQASRFGEASQTLIISFGPFYRILAVGAGLYALLLLVEVILLAQGRDPGRMDLEGSGAATPAQGPDTDTAPDPESDRP